MTEPGFSRDGTTDLYWADPGDPIAAFLATEPDVLGANPTLTRTWEDAGGAYVFVGRRAPPTFLDNLRSWLRDYRPLGPPRLLWILDPNADPTAWVTTELAVTPGPSGTWIVAGATFPFADYAVAVSGGTAIGPGETTDGGWGFVLTDTQAEPGLTLYTPVDLFPATAGTAVLSIAAGHTGTWRFVLDAPAAAGDAFARLGAGIRYFTAGADGYVHAVHFDAFRQPAATPIILHAQLDPLRPFDRSRSALGFFSWTGAGTPPVLPSGYATAHGHGVNLQPQAGAQLVFGFAPFFGDQQGNGGYYFVPDGPFSISVTRSAADASGIARVVCGTSGLEYLGVPSTGGCDLTFVPGQPAFAPLGSAVTGADALTDHGTTSWVAVDAPPATPVNYYSQPEDAPLFSAAPTTAGGADDELDLLDFFELPAATLASAAQTDDGGVAVGPVTFPMAPFRGLALGDVDEAVAIEQLALAPRRRAAIVTAPARDLTDDDTARVGVTPQGLGIGVAADGSSWTWLGIGHTGAVAPIPDLRFTTVSGPFQQAMQTNNLFLVLGNAAELATCGSVGYQLTAPALDVIGTLPVGQGVRRTVLDAVRALMTDVAYRTRDLFRTALAAAASEITPEEELVFLRYGGELTPIVGGWPFRVSPDNWGPQTYLVVKFVLGRSIADLVTDVSTWAWPAASSATGNPLDAQKAIGDVIAAAVAAPSTSPYANFATVVTDPDWTGLLALSVEVPLGQLPAELQVLAAGIDPARFTAHHFGMSATPYRITSGQIEFDRSSMFGLIDYQNREDQYFSENVAFAFRVLQLTVGIRNSVVTTFTSRAELLVNRLFGAPTRLLPTTRGNNVVLDGAHQRQRLPDGTEHDTYVFSMSGDNTFQVDGLVLQTVELLAVQLVTARASDPATGSATVDAVFQMAGNLRFYEPPGFDPFCWGPTPLETSSALRFGNLGVAMSFQLSDPASTTTFTLQDGNLSFDLANSVARPGSLVARFPIRLSGLVATADPALSPSAPRQTPADLGFVSVTAPIDQSTLARPWYGLEYTIDLGTLGVLAGSKALAIQVLAAWSPGVDAADPAIYLGVKLPGAKDLLGVSLPLQGVIKMGFKGIEFLVDDQPGVERSYTVRMRDFALRLLGLAFPPGHNDVILFGNPDQSGSSKVGWYLAYASDSDPKRPPAPPTKAELARRRTTLRTGS